MSLLAPLLALLACADPDRKAAEAYVAAVQPIFVDNMALNRQFVEVATEVKRNTASPRAIGLRFEQSLVPGAVELRDRVLAITPEQPELAALHQGLGLAWTARVDAWTGVHKAWQDADLAAFDAAVQRNIEVKTAEERYIVELNAWLAPHELSLRQFP